MTRFCIILITLISISFSAAKASENVLFMKIPEGISLNEANIAVNHVAAHRKWVVSELEGNKLRIKLNHKNYRAMLDFSFSTDEITYSDLSSYLNSGVYDDSESIWETKAAPRKWVNNLKKDVRSILIIIKKIKSKSDDPAFNNAKEKLTYEETTAKLVNLKKLYDKKLLTKAEYGYKKKEIMSRY